MLQPRIYHAFINIFRTRNACSDAHSYLLGRKVRLIAGGHWTLNFWQIYASYAVMLPYSYCTPEYDKWTHSLIDYE